MNREHELRRLGSALRALEARRRQEMAETRRGAYVLVVLVIGGLVIADRAWGFGLWIALRELLLHLR